MPRKQRHGAVLSDDYPLTWREDCEFTWSGRQLTSLYNPLWGTLTFTYNDEGIRTKKQWVFEDDSTETIEYILDDSGNVVMEKYVFEGDGYETETVIIYYFYDESGAPVYLTYNGTSLYYVKNLQGDITGLMTADGTIVISYEYDAWGNVIEERVYNSGYSRVRDLQLFRYRGYIYDGDTGLYYLRSRYYDPTVGRFINADDTIFLGFSRTVLSYNLYSYCLNNPAINSDSWGYGVLPVGVPGFIAFNYRSTVTKWASKYAPMSNGVEYGAMIYKVKLWFATFYFMGETYKGFKTTNWYTVINGLGVGYATSVVARFVTRNFGSNVNLKLIGFAHTHPLGHANDPSGPDDLMWIWGKTQGMSVFPIAASNNGSVSVFYM